jgi:hypothetical protein
VIDTVVSDFVDFRCGPLGAVHLRRFDLVANISTNAGMGICKYSVVDDNGTLVISDERVFLPLCYLPVV